MERMYKILGCVIILITFILPKKETGRVDQRAKSILSKKIYLSKSIRIPRYVMPWGTHLKGSIYKGLVLLYIPISMISDLWKLTL